ncbi:MAG: D-tyrosyl-tRNA(Tyr) deacylase [Clostridia bacterium]|nr:D-tyrosyl-tRNA(Tyr) deacylase [Clostridia bacterium]
MKAVVQRTKEVTLTVNGELISKIPFGLIVYFGVKVGDDFKLANYLASKITKLRIFEDENGKMNRSVKDVGGEIMCVSQFTLYGDVSHGNRPSFTSAEVPDKASLVYDYFCEKLKEEGVVVKKGVFGADMKILQLSDGPVTIIYDL